MAMTILERWWQMETISPVANYLITYKQHTLPTHDGYPTNEYGITSDMVKQVDCDYKYLKSAYPNVELQPIGLDTVIVHMVEIKTLYDKLPTPWCYGKELIKNRYPNTSLKYKFYNWLQDSGIVITHKTSVVEMEDLVFDIICKQMYIDFILHTFKEDKRFDVMRARTKVLKLTTNVIK